MTPASNGTDMVFEWGLQEGLVIGEDYLVEVSTSLSPWSPVPTGDYDVDITRMIGIFLVHLSKILTLSV